MGGHEGGRDGVEPKSETVDPQGREEAEGEDQAISREPNDINSGNGVEARVTLQP